MEKKKERRREILSLFLRCAQVEGLSALRDTGGRKKGKIGLAQPLYLTVLAKKRKRLERNVPLSKKRRKGGKEEQKDISLSEPNPGGRERKKKGEGDHFFFHHIIERKQKENGKRAYYPSVIATSQRAVTSTGEREKAKTISSSLVLRCRRQGAFINP